MNDATPWIDPELVAAGQLLQSRGLVAPDRTQASLSEVRAATDRIGAFLGEGSVPLQRERDLSLPGPHGQVPCRLYLPDDAEQFSFWIANNLFSDPYEKQALLSLTDTRLRLEQEINSLKGLSKEKAIKKLMKLKMVVEQQL